MIEKILPTLLLFGGFYLVTKNLGSRGLHSFTFQLNLSRV